MPKEPGSRGLPPARPLVWCFLVLGVLVGADGAAAERIRVAVASNFSQPMKAIVGAFEQASEHEVTPVFGSTGKHYAQIVHGAPFEVFLAADAWRPRLLESRGLAVAGTRFTYAVGRIVLWSPRHDLVDANGRVLESGDFRHLAIANPDLAPYGIAARQTLEALGLWQQMQDRLVRGENIGHAFHFVKSGNAELGFVALSQIRQPGRARPEGSYWEVPRDLYSPIEQQAVLLVDSDPARSFVTFLANEPVRTILEGYGYTSNPR